MPQALRFALILPAMLLASTGWAEARGGFNPDRRVPRISLCPGCTVSVKIVVLKGS